VHEIEDSKYDGKPLIQPRVPYHFKVRTLKVDKSLPFLSRAYLRSVFYWESLCEYLMDILTWRTDAFSFKTAEFCKRNFNKVRSMLSHLLYEIRKVKQGFGRLKKDILFYFGIQKKNIKFKYREDSFQEAIKVRQVKTDVIKFIPFSFFIIVPGAEILLPPFLMVFPNSVPSQFMSEQQRAQKFEEIKQRRIKAGQYLVQQLPTFLSSLEKDAQIPEKDIPAIRNLKKDLKKPKLLPTDLLQYKPIFKRYLDFRLFNVKQLQKMAYFMSLEPVTGLNTVNNILKICKLHIPIDYPGIQFFTRAILVRELNMYFSRIRKEDESLSFDLLDSFSQEEIQSICFKRGIEIEKNELKHMVQDLKLWLSISNQRNVPHSLLLYTRIHDFTTDQFQISDDEDDNEILRRVSLINLIRAVPE
jgi:LETM1 and EF-hand domain-containing protein 1